jgi:hypothetical protein
VGVDLDQGIKRNPQMLQHCFCCFHSIVVVGGSKVFGTRVAVGREKESAQNRAADKGHCCGGSEGFCTWRQSNELRDTGLIPRTVVRFKKLLSCRKDVIDFVVKMHP